MNRPRKYCVACNKANYISQAICSCGSDKFRRNMLSENFINDFKREIDNIRKKK